MWGKFGRLIQARFDYLVFVYGNESTFAWGLLIFILGRLSLTLPPSLVWALAVGGTAAAILSRIIAGAKIYRKWSGNKLLVRPYIELLEYHKGPQWNTEHGIMLQSVGQQLTNQSLMWTDSEVNSLLSQARLNTTNQIFSKPPVIINGTLKRSTFELPKFLRDIAPISLRTSNVKTGRKKLPVRFNGKLLRLGTEPTPQQLTASNLEIQKVTYFDGECSNEIFRFAKKGNMETGSPAESYAFDREKRFKALENSALANIIGISIFAVTKDNFVLFVRQSHGNSVSPGAFASSGSGSLEYRDLQRLIRARNFRDSDFDLADLILTGMFREMCEESGVLDSEIVRETARITSYFRWISRAAKPEFTGIVKLRCTFADLQKRKISGGESTFTRNISSVPLKTLVDCSSLFHDANDGISPQLRWGEASRKATKKAMKSLSLTHTKWSNHKTLSELPHLSPSCEFAWIAAANLLSQDQDLLNEISLTNIS